MWSCRADQRNFTRLFPFKFNLHLLHPDPRPPPNVALDLSGGNNSSPILGKHPWPFLVDTLRDIRLFVAASSWLDFSTGTGTTSLGQRRCSLVGGGPSSAFTVLGLRGCSRCGFRGCYLVKSSQTPLVHTLHPGLCSIFAFTTLIPSPPLPFLFFLSVGAPRRVYRVPASTWPAGLFFPQWCSKACVQGFRFFFFVPHSTPPLSLPTLESHNPVPPPLLDKVKLILSPILSWKSTWLTLLSLSFSPNYKQGRDLSPFVEPRVLRPCCSLTERSITESSIPQGCSWRQFPALLPPPFILVKSLISVSASNLHTPNLRSSPICVCFARRPPSCRSRQDTPRL